MLRAFLASRLLSLVVAPLLASGPLALALAPDLAEPAIALPAVRGARLVDTLANLPAAWRGANWLGLKGQGSCVHAALVHLLHWQGRHDLAEFWARNFGDGETFAGVAAKLDQAGVRWAGTTAGDEQFLAWAIRTRRGAAVVVAEGRHMVNLVGLDQTSAHILDSNAPETVATWPRDKFLSEWHRSGGWAVTPVYSPPPPRPRQTRRQGDEETRSLPVSLSASLPVSLSPNLPKESICSLD
jgi:hypothetical protein